MKRSKLLAVSGALTLLALPGCVNMPKLVRELKSDPAAVKLTVHTVWVNVELTRLGARTNESITMGSDGTLIANPRKE